MSFEPILVPYEPYNSHTELVDDRISAIRQRAGALRDHRRQAAHQQFAWPQDLAGLETRIERRAGRTNPGVIPIAYVQTRCSLTFTESLVLWLLIAHELCPIVRGLVRELNTEVVSDPTTDAIRHIVYGANNADRQGWQELSDRGALRRFALIERSDESASIPMHRQTWRVSERVLALVHGELALADRVSGIARIKPSPAIDLELSPGVLDRARAGWVTGGLIIASGAAGSGRSSALAFVAAEHGRGVLEVDSTSLARDPDLIRLQLRGLAFECALLELVPLFRDFDVLAPTNELPDRLGLVEAEIQGAMFATASRAIARSWRRPARIVELSAISGSQRAALWARAIPSLGEEDITSLATLYPMAPALIHTAGMQLAHSCGDVHPDTEDITETLRSLIDGRMAGLATRVNVTQTWDDLVLPAEQTTSIVELIARVHERQTVYETWGFDKKIGRGKGVLALFSGPPGTGKTMAAGLIARDLGVEIYQVDLSKIMSKWIGETEKNLATLFDVAEASHAILLFDEADALFAKRTEVRSSNDRHANQEVNYLLQRMEAFTGIVILTTNFAASIDTAFRRRLSMHLQFPMPEQDERERLWAAMIPEELPVEGLLALESLAERFEMSGGYIRNAVIRAAFIAAAERRTIGRRHLEYAARLEYEAMGKIVHVAH